MRAGVLYGPGDLRVEECPLPSLGTDDVLVRVSHNGLCGTDATEFSKGPLMVPLHEPHPNSGHVGPTILGHEFIGTVVDAGDGARGRIGERIACGAGVSCGTCTWCRAGRTNLCATYYTLGLSTHGGLAEFAAAPSAICTAIPDGLTDVDAALAQPFAVGLHAVDRARLRGGERVVVLGCGAIGSFIIAALATHDGDVVAVDIDADRLAVATKLGATSTVLLERDSSDAQALEQIGHAECVFETSGIRGSAQRAITLASRGGAVVLVSLTKAAEQLALTDLVLREITIETTVAHVCDRNLGQALTALAARPLADILPVHVVGLDDVVDLGLDRIVTGRAQGKILVGIGAQS